MNKRISQADIAKQIGINASTVSRALKNDPRISDEVRKKVFDAAQELGYRPDPAVSALANYRWKSAANDYSGTVAWITVGDEPGALRKQYPEFELYWKGALGCAKRFGYRIEEFSITDGESLVRLEKILFARNVQGLLLPPEILPFMDWGQLQADNFSIVRMSRSVHKLHAHLVTTNQTADGLLASKKMNEQGYKRIGFAGTKYEERLFYPGFAWGQQNQEAAEWIPPLFLNKIPEADRVAACAQWIERYQPDAILEDFNGFYEILKEIGIRVPEDLGVTTQNPLRNPNTAGVMQNLEEVGRVAMLMLISLISDHDRGIPEIARQVLVKGQWVDGPSLPKQNELVD